MPKEKRRRCALFTISKAVLEEIHDTIGRRPAEHGGALGGRRDDRVVTHFFFDRSARRTGATYSPDHERLNRLFDQDWNPRGVNFLGFAHSHPPGCAWPSAGDLRYTRDILAAIPKLDCLFLPIVMTEPDTGRFELIPFAAVRQGKSIQIERLPLVVVNPGADATQENSDMSNNEKKTANVGVRAPATALNLSETFRRVRGAYDLDRLARCRAILVGVGGAAAFAEDLARTGVGEHVLLDPDVVSETNLATQQVYRRDVGRPKVDCLAERILDINPAARVVARAAALDDLDDAAVAALAREPLLGEPPLVTLLCGFTDSFPAQARVNRLALQFGLPSLCAQVYLEGRGAEVTFTYPDVTPACHRCVLSSRYRAYLDEGFRNTVTSDGTPIFATTRLNAIKGFIALALLHHGSSHPRWGGLLTRIGNRNLTQIRLDPDLASTVGLSVFDRVLAGADTTRLLFDEAVWLPQEPERAAHGRPACPDCGGTGDLRDAVGRFTDTRVMPRGEDCHAAAS